jgi:hypothetical protein
LADLYSIHREISWGGQFTINKRAKNRRLKVKKVIISLGLILFVGGLGAVAAEKGQWTGWLSDAKCAANGAKAAHKGCSIKCVESGQAIVFVAEDKKVYKLQGTDKIKSMVGDRVVLSGSMEGDTITVDSAKAAESK